MTAMDSARTRADPVLRAEANLCRSLKAWALGSVGGLYEQHSSVVVASSGAPMRSFNQILVRQPPADGSATLREAIELCRARAPKFRARFRDGIDAGETEAVLREAGLLDRGGIPCLASDGLEHGGDFPLTIRAVRDEDVLSDHVDVVAESFGWAAADLARVFTRALLDDASWCGYVGYADGEPVATSQLVVHEGVAGIYYVGTRESCRGRGFGEALTRYAMREGAAAGCDMASLQSSPAGYPIYLRIGFRDIAYYKTFVSE